MIATFQSRFGARTLEEHAARNPSFAMDNRLPADGVAASPVVEAQVFQSRWVCRCPICDGAENAAPYRNGVPVFFCCNCRNQASGLVPLPVRFPPDAAAIEAALDIRPDPATRNWLIGETVDELLAENATYGVAA